MADRIAVMRSGVLQQIEHAARALRRPANLFVAGFIGSPAMNLLPGEDRGRRVSSCRSARSR